MRLRVHSISAGLLPLVLLAATPGLLAAPPGFDAWWASMTAGGAAGPDIDGVEIRYEVAWLEVPTPEEMAAMRARVAGRPEHPDRARLEVAERRMRKPDVAECRLWRLDGQWRYAVTYPDSPVGYVDCVWSRKSAWRLSPGQLHLFSLNPKDERTRDVVRMSSNFSYESTLLLNGGLSGPVGRGLDLRPTLVGADRWALDAATPTPEGGAGRSGQRIRVRASGRWDGAAGVGTVDRVVLEGLNDAGEVSDAEVMTAEGWTTLPGSAVQIARQVRVEGADGRPIKRVTLILSARFTPEEFERLIEPPGPTAVDPVRGEMTYSSVMDYRGGTAQQVGASELARGVLPAPPARAGSGEARLRVLGWVLAGGLVATLVFLRLRRSAA